MDFVTEESRGAAYYYVGAEGICRNRLRDGARGGRQCVLRGSYAAFGIFPERDAVHIVAASTDGELIYAKCTDGGAEKFILTKIPAGAKITKISLYPVRGRLNMLFCMQNDGDSLMHCILGNNALPHRVSALGCADFFVAMPRVYYVRPDGAAGFSELADERPEIFVRLANNASVPYVYAGHMIYLSGGKIYFDNREIFADEKASAPIITEADAQLFALWRSGEFVRYMPCPGGGKKPSCIINPSGELRLFEVLCGGRRQYFYGTCSPERVTFYVNSSPFGSAELTAAENLRRRMTEMKREIDELRAELSRYGK